MMGLFFGRRSQPPARSTRSQLPPGPVVTAGGYSSVDLSRTETSLQKVAVWSSVDLIASLGSELPVDVFRGTGKAQAPIRTPGYLEDPGADGQGLEDWLYQLYMTWLLRGNANGRVLDRAAAGYPTAVELFHPDHVTVWLEDGQPVFSYMGRRLEPEEVFHRRVYPMPGYVMGLSPIAHHAVTIGLGLSAERFGSQWFQDGAHPSGMLVNSEVDLNPEMAATAKQRFLAALHGTREPLVLGRGWKYERIQIAPEESQFLETNNMTSAECARIFGPGIAEVLGYESGGGSLTYANVESRSTHLLVYSMNRWLRRAERVLTSMLPRGQYARFNRDALLQSTTLARFQAHQIALQNRWTTVNEVRDLENKQPVPWGDVPNDTPPAGVMPTGGTDGNDP